MTVNMLAGIHHQSVNSLHFILKQRTTLNRTVLYSWIGLLVKMWGLKYMVKLKAGGLSAHFLLSSRKHLPSNYVSELFLAFFTLW